jgi:thiol-disulfide isomerase/thioredoxin
MRRLTATLLIALAVSACCVAFADDAPPTKIAWHKTLDSALDAAKTSGKPVMVDFTAEWCHFCQQLDTETYTDPKVVALSEKFECAKVDADREDATCKKYAARSFPTIVFLSGDQEALRTVGFSAAPVFLAKMQLALDNQKLVAEIPDLQAKANANPPDAAAVARLGHVYTVTEKNEKAQPLLDQAAKLDKGGQLGLLVDVKLDQAIIESRRRDRAALADLKAWIEANPGSPRMAEARLQRGYTLAVTGDMDGALADFDAVVAAQPDGLQGLMAANYSKLIRDEAKVAKPGGS